MVLLQKCNYAAMMQVWTFHVKQSWAWRHGPYQVIAPILSTSSMSYFNSFVFEITHVRGLLIDTYSFTILMPLLVNGLLG